MDIIIGIAETVQRYFRAAVHVESDQSLHT